MNLKKYLLIIFIFLVGSLSAQDSLFIMKNGTVDYRIALKDLDSLVFENTVEEEINYNLGDEGPAGGYVFYDKGEYSNGWRYLEVAPNDVGTAPWGCGGDKIPETDKNIGFGKFNTTQILTFCGEEDIAARVCDAYELNGFEDWFLPSTLELVEISDEIYSNDIGDYKGGQQNEYWASDDFSSFASVVAFRRNFDALEASIGKSVELLVLPVRRF